MADEQTNSPENDFEKTVKTLVNEVRPMLQQDGGDCELVSIDGKVVSIRFRGACSGCPHAAMTLKMGIERYLKDKCPDIEEVVAVP